MRKPDAKPLKEPAPHEVTNLLKQWSGGDSTALDRVIPLVYEALHRLAHQHMRRERAGHLLHTSALINEAYLRLVNEPELTIENRAHFFGIAARLMRQILVAEARKRSSAKRGGDAIQRAIAAGTVTGTKTINDTPAFLINLPINSGNKGAPWARSFAMP